MIGESAITKALHKSCDPAMVPEWLRWRTGRKVGRTIYAQVGPTPSDNDELIGVMDTRTLAAEAVAGHNAALSSQAMREREAQLTSEKGGP